MHLATIGSAAERRFPRPRGVALADAREPFASRAASAAPSSCRWPSRTSRISARFSPIFAIAACRRSTSASRRRIPSVLRTLARSTKPGPDAVATPTLRRMLRRAPSARVRRARADDRSHATRSRKRHCGADSQCAACAVEWLRRYERTIRRRRQARSRGGKGRRARPLRPAARAGARPVPRLRNEQRCSRGAKRERLLWDLAERVEAFIVQREACGLRDSRHVLSTTTSRARSSRGSAPGAQELTGVNARLAAARSSARWPLRMLNIARLPSWHAYSNMP